jgi:hypothetical protein
MAFPISGSPAPLYPAVANPAYSGVFIPQIWSGKLIEKFYDATVLTAIANTTWEGEIKNQGDKVIIRTKPTLTIRAYQSGQALSYEKPSSNVVELNIDQGAYFGTVLDDVMEVQSDLNQMSMWADDASEQMKIYVDADVLRTVPSGIVAANKGATAGRISASINLGTNGAPITLTKDNVLEKLVDLGTVLDEQNIPETGRWIVMPPWAAGLLKKSELRDASLTGDGTSVLRNGRLGMIDRFTLYSSNQLPTSSNDVDASGAAITGNNADGATHILAGHSHGLTFASQLSKMETLRPESTFGTMMRGLQIWGRKVVDGVALTELYAKPA